MKKFKSYVLIDRSGSMGHIRDKTVDSINEYVNGLGTECDVRVYFFDSPASGIDLSLVRNTTKANYIPIDIAEYVPGGMTPLYDAIGLVIRSIEKETIESDERVALVILTDGQENASKEFDKNEIKKMIEDHEKNDNWLILYLGANQDAMAEAAKFGVSKNNSLDWSVNADMSAISRGLASRTVAYAVSGNQGEYSDEFRVMSMTNADNASIMTKPTPKKGK